MRNFNFSHFSLFIQFRRRKKVFLSRPAKGTRFAAEASRFTLRLSHISLWLLIFNFFFVSVAAFFIVFREVLDTSTQQHVSDRNIMEGKPHHTSWCPWLIFSFDQGATDDDGEPFLLVDFPFVRFSKVYDPVRCVINPTRLIPSLNQHERAAKRLKSGDPIKIDSWHENRRLTWNDCLSRLLHHVKSLEQHTLFSITDNKCCGWLAQFSQSIDCWSGWCLMRCLH